MRNFSPRTQQQNNRLIIRDQRGFGGGVYDDPSGEGNSSTADYSENYVLFPWGAVPRGGTKALSDTPYPSLPGRTGYTLTKAGNVVTKTAGANFTPADIGNFIVYSDGATDGDHEMIIGYTSATVVIVENTTAQTPAAVSSWIRGPAEQKVHEGKNKWLLHIDQRLFVAAWNIPAWVECTRIGLYKLSTGKSVFKEYGDWMYIWNDNRIFKINMADTVPIYYPVNTEFNSVPITDQVQSSTTPYLYRYLYCMSRLRGAGVNGNRTTAGATVEQQSGPTILDFTRGRDYSSIYRTRPLGEGLTTYAVLTGGAIPLTVAQYASTPNANFRITIDGVSYNFVVDFTGVTSWAEIASRIQSAIQAVSSKVTVVYSSGVFIITNDKDGGTLTVTSVGDAGVDIGATAMGCQNLVGTITSPSYTSPNILVDMWVPNDPVNTTTYQQHWNRYSVYRTLDLGVNGKNPQKGTANPSDLYIWVNDYPVCKVFTAEVSAGGVITITDPATGCLTADDVGAQIVWQGGVSKTILTVTSATAGTCAAGAIASSSAAIGVTITVQNIITGSMTGGVFTRASGRSFITTDVGKVLYLSTGEEAVITGYTSGNAVSINITSTVAAVAAAINPIYRTFADRVRDDYNGTTTAYQQLRTRDNGFSLPNRFWESLPSNCNCGTINNGFLFAALRGDKKGFYSQMPPGLEFLAGYHNPNEQILLFKDNISHFQDFEGIVGIIQNNRIESVPTNTYYKKILPSVGEVVAILTGQYEVDATVGCRDWGSIREIAKNTIQFRTQEPGVRQLSYSGQGFKLSENLAYNRILEELNELRGNSASAYDSVNGYQFWDRNTTSLVASTTPVKILYLVGVPDADWADPLNWSTESGGAGGAGSPDATTYCYLDANSPNCTLYADGNGYYLSTAGYTKTLDLNGYTLTLET